jgi:hypothetical protein
VTQIDLARTRGDHLFTSRFRSDLHANPQAQSISLEDIFTWTSPPCINLIRVRSSNRVIDPDENQAFTIEGEVWRVKPEASDCDFHVEMAAPGRGASARRVIVEMPQDSAFNSAPSDFK